ncbi:MAG: TolC family protein [Flavobacteriaceae bacterium]
MKTLILTAITLLVFSFSNAQQLNVFIEKALSNNPTIQHVELQHNIASEKINESKTIPNTELGLGYFVSEPETRTGAQHFKLSAKQMLPWFGTITARENYANALADVKYEDIVIAKRKLVLSVSQSYYKLYTLKAKQKIVKENINLLHTYETLALNSLEIGKASAVDVLRLQMKQNELDQLTQVLEQNYLAELTAFNKLLNRDKNTKIDVPDELIIPFDEISDAKTDLTLHPELMKYDKLFQSIEQSELLHKKNKKPMIGFGLDYIAVSERPNMTFNENGKDIVMPMLSVSIPVFNKKNASITKQNELKLQEITFQKLERKNSLETALDKAIKNKLAAEITYKTQVKNLKQAKNAEEILIKNYETGTIDFNDVLDIQELQLKFQTSQIEAIKNFYIESIIINYLTK